MMRALGFKQDHVHVFVILQAFSFSVPGCLLGLLVSVVLNEGFREFMYILLQNADEYGLTANSIVISLLLFGFIVPIISIMGPTKEAMGKNLRASLDASRRNGQSESVSATVKKLQDLGISRREVLFGAILIVFGLFTYYLIPLSLLFENYGLYFFVTNSILTGITVGMVVLAVIIMKHLQKIILKILLFTCCRTDKKLDPIISKRLEDGQSKNTKIALMITGSVGFLIL